MTIFGLENLVTPLLQLKKTFVCNIYNWQQPTPTLVNTVEKLAFICLHIAAVNNIQIVRDFYVDVTFSDDLCAIKYKINNWDKDVQCIILCIFQNIPRLYLH